MIDFRALCKNDLPLLYSWFQEPTINQLYARSQTWSLKNIENKYLPRLTGHDNVPSFIIHLDNEAIGFIQYYCLSEHYPETLHIVDLETKEAFLKTPSDLLFFDDYKYFSKEDVSRIAYICGQMSHLNLVE